jgi:hypothetical protein
VSEIPAESGSESSGLVVWLRVSSSWGVSLVSAEGSSRVLMVRETGNLYTSGTHFHRYTVRLSTATAGGTRSLLKLKKLSRPPGCFGSWSERMQTGRGTASVVLFGIVRSFDTLAGGFGGRSGQAEEEGSPQRPIRKARRL